MAYLSTANHHFIKKEKISWFFFAHTSPCKVVFFSRLHLERQVSTEEMYSEISSLPIPPPKWPLTINRAAAAELPLSAVFWQGADM